MSETKPVSCLKSACPIKGPPGRQTWRGGATESHARARGWSTAGQPRSSLPGPRLRPGDRCAAEVRDGVLGTLVRAVSWRTASLRLTASPPSTWRTSSTPWTAMAPKCRSPNPWATPGDDGHTDEAPVRGAWSLARRQEDPDAGKPKIRHRTHLGRKEGAWPGSGTWLASSSHPSTLQGALWAPPLFTPPS